MLVPMSPVGYMLCECAEHGTVCAKHLQEEGQGGVVESYLCPGREGDTGGCNARIRPLGQPCFPAEWAEYADEH
jgi:hypothetical protein